MSGRVERWGCVSGRVERWGCVSGHVERWGCVSGHVKRCVVVRHVRDGVVDMWNGNQNESICKGIATKCESCCGDYYHVQSMSLSGGSDSWENSFK